MRAKYCITLKNILYTILPMVLFLSLIISIGLLIVSRLGIVLPIMKSLLIVFILINILPVLYLLVEYLIIDFKTSIEISFSEKKMKIIRKGSKTTFLLKEIKELVYYESFFDVAPFAGFMLYYIVLNDDTKILVTSILLKDVLLPKDIKERKIECFFPSKIFIQNKEKNN
jgi:hypothetical protein